MRDPVIKSPHLSEGEKQIIANLLSPGHYIREVAVSHFLKRYSRTLERDASWLHDYEIIILIWNNSKREFYMRIYLKEFLPLGRFCLLESYCTYALPQEGLFEFCFFPKGFDHQEESERFRIAFVDALESARFEHEFKRIYNIMNTYD